MCFESATESLELQLKYCINKMLSSTYVLWIYWVLAQEPQQFHFLDPCYINCFLTCTIDLDMFYCSGFQTSPWSTPSTAHFVCLPISDKPTSGIAVSTNELMGWIRCDRWGRHTICAGLEVLQDRFENHWVMAVPSNGNEPCQYNIFWHLLCYNIAKSFFSAGVGNVDPGGPLSCRV